MRIIWGLITICLNCPNAVNTLKEVWLPTEMTSGPLRPWLFQIINIGILTFLFAFNRSQICWTPMKIWRFQKIESHAILLQFAFNKKLMQIETCLRTIHLVCRRGVGGLGTMKYFRHIWCAMKYFSKFLMGQEHKIQLLWQI